jgi:cellulose synthase/poly-beta-1,6-N-acetylglucosamine synthase-like glycosyltransferase
MDMSNRSISHSSPYYGADGSLDAVRNPHHWSYKLPGLLVWSILGFTLLAAVEAPQWALAGIRLLGLYVLFRVMLSVIYYPVGLARCHWQARGALRRRLQAPLAQAPAHDPARQVHHVVLLPNYREPVGILERTLAGLAAQENAIEQLTVVLAMEAADPQAETKAAILKRQFAGCFAHLLVTIHPANLPGEIPGKGCNQRWAALQAREFLTCKQGMSLDQLTLTSCDADSLFHPDYFGEVARLFAADPERHFRYWQAPLRFDNNIWRIHPFVRVLTMLASVLNLSELANPFVLKLTQSTYTFSFRLADAIDYWDTQVVAEDSHILLRGFFGSEGRASLRAVFLPISGDAVTGDTPRQALRNFYRQRTRHAWACQNTAYMLQQWNEHPQISFSQKLLYLLQVLQDYSLFATAVFLLALGWLLGLVVTGSPVTSFFILAIPTALFVLVNAIGSAGTWLIWAIEHMRAMQDVSGWRPSLMFMDLLTWIVMPVVTLLMAVLPVLHANTKMLAGSQLLFVRTQKEGEVSLHPSAPSNSQTHT